MTQDVRLFHEPSRGIDWNVRIIRQGQSYGLADSLIHDKAEPLVEFFDARFKHTPLGQFVARYYLSTLVESKNEGLCLDGQTWNWVLEAQAFREVQDWLRTM